MKRAAILCLTIAALVAGLWSWTRRGPRSEALLGIWTERDARLPADEVRFYYFHKGGKGLYRYGQIGHNQTHSFDWRLTGDRLELDFRKRGEHARTRIVLGEEGGRRTLTLVEDPRGEGRVRYRLVPSHMAELGALTLPSTPAAPQEAPSTLAGRLWIDLRRYATGGVGFVMYQLSEHAAQEPGWKIGWHHVGDFDDWATEQLVYRVEPGALSWRFVLRGQQASSPVELGRAGERRTLTLTRDPRNFLHKTVLVDGGPSF